MAPFREPGLHEKVRIRKGMDIVHEEIFQAALKSGHPFFGPTSVQEGIEGLNKKASAGYNWPGKKGELLSNNWPQFFESYVKFLHSSAEECCENYNWAVIPKHEVLEAYKFFHKERIISICPPELNLAAVINLKNHFDTINTNWHAQPLRQGISAFNGQYESLMKHHDSFEQHASLDVTALETSFSPWVHNLIAACECQYADTPRQKEIIMKLAACHSEWLACCYNGRSFKVRGHEPSGSSKTIHDNSKYVASVVHGALWRLGKRRADYALSVVGDDVFLSWNGKLDFDRLMKLIRETFAMKILARGTSVYGMPFLSRTISRKRSGPISVNPQKMITNLHYKGKTPLEQGEIVSNLMVELANNDKEKYLLRNYADYLDNFYHVNVRQPSPTLVASLFRPGVTPCSG